MAAPTQTADTCADVPEASTEQDKGEYLGLPEFMPQVCIPAPGGQLSFRVQLQLSPTHPQGCFY